MALRVLRLVGVASILAFALTVGTISATHAATDDPATEAPSSDVETPSTELGEPIPSDPPPPIDPLPSEPPSVEEPPPAEPVEPAPKDPPPGETPPADTSPTEPPLATEPPPADTVGDNSSEPQPAEIPPADVPPTDPVVAEEPPPPGPVEPAPSEAPPADPPLVDILPAEPPAEEPPPADIVGSASTDPAASEPAASDPTAADPTALPVPDPYGAERAPSQPSAQRSRAGISPATRKPAQTATAPVAAAVRAPPKQIVDELEAPIETVSLDRAAAAGAGLAAGLAATNRATASVAVAIEFGRAGGGWAGAIVFNIWLRRQLRERRMSQRRLAALSGVDHSTISRLLREDRRPSLTTATKLVGALRHVRGEQAESDTADYFERTPEETVFPARRVELALRADEELDDDQVRRLMSIYLNARRRHQETASRPAAPARAGPARAGAARAVPDRS